MAELPALTRGGEISTPAGATCGRTATGAVSRFENGWVFGPWGFDSLSFRLSFRRGRVGKTRGCYPRERRFEPCRRSSRPRGRSGYDAALSTRKLRVRVPPGVCDRLVVGELATPPASGAGDRRSTPAGQTCFVFRRAAAEPGSGRREPPRPGREARWRRGCPREPHELETVARI